jgi:TolB-like protein
MSAEPQVRDDGEPAAALVRAYLERLLGTAAFLASPRRRKLLAYLVERTLAGHGDRLKAYDIALSVLGRDEGFDPQADPIVRIEVGRLRRDLEHYYLTAGGDDPIRITIPRGRYVPAFEARGGPIPQPELAALPARLPKWRWSLPGWPAAAVLAAGCAVLALVAAAAAIWATWRADGGPQAVGPVLVVVPFQSLGGGEGGQLLADGLTNGLIADLMRFDGLQVFAAAPGGDAAVPLPAAAAGAPTYTVSGGVERAPDRARVTARLTDRLSGEVLWSERYDRPLTTGDIVGVEDELVAGIASRLAQVYGVVNTAAALRLARTPPATVFAYDCVQRAFAYRRTFDLDRYPAVRACLEESVRRDPGYAGAWAMLAFAHLDAARFGLVEPAARPGELDAGMAAARRAVELAPDGVRSLQSLAALLYGTGDFDEAERVQRRAIALNPHDPEGLAQLGWRLTARGRWDEGARLLQQAVDRSLVVPSWYHENLAYSLYLGGEFGRARDQAELAKPSCCGFGYTALALTEAALGRVEAARTALAQAIRASPLLERDPVEYWARFQASPEVIARLNAGLAKVGLRLPPSG